MNLACQVIRRLTLGSAFAGLLAAGCSGGGGLTQDSSCEDLLNTTPQEQLRFAQDYIDEFQPKDQFGNVYRTADLASELAYNCPNNLDASLKDLIDS